MTDYQKFQLQWMIDHDHSIEELINELEKAEFDRGSYETFTDVYDRWELDAGFGGEIWPCENEWKDAEGKE
jgi:hypothetical protein